MPVNRLIPAHAGKTPSRSPSRRGWGAHPRSRGENRCLCGTLWSASGSSPLTRGKRSRGGLLLRLLRLIPAHAGKTPSWLGHSAGNPAHPRSRGENASRDAHNSEPTGSSPLTRGKPPSLGRYQAVPRLIPAHAGKTEGSPIVNGTEWAHPRSRGENWEEYTGQDGRFGSSPLTRGKPDHTVAIR